MLVNKYGRLNGTNMILLAQVCIGELPRLKLILLVSLLTTGQKQANARKKHE